MAVTLFAFEEHLVRVIERDSDPWFVGKDVCVALGLKNHNDALAKLNEDEKGVGSTDPLCRGGEQKVALVSEPGVYRLTFSSRKPEAERFKRWLAHEVLPQIRKTGRFAPAEPVEPSPDPSAEVLLHRLHLVREARILFGRDRARSLWRTLGLPAVPPPPPGPLDEARVCLRHLLDRSVGGGEGFIRDFIERALDEDETARARLIPCGIKVVSELEGFIVANRSPGLDQVYEGTEWTRGRHMRVLRRLAGTAATGVHRINGRPTRGTFLPAVLLDEDAQPSSSFYAQGFA